MWLGIHPRYLCDQHLLGEHAELHQEVGQIQAGNHASVRGHIEHGQVDPHALQERHTAIVGELLKRGMNHDSPLPGVDVSGFDSPDWQPATVRQTLRERCADCREHIAEVSIV